MLKAHELAVVYQADKFNSNDLVAEIYQWHIKNTTASVASRLHSFIKTESPEEKKQRLEKTIKAILCPRVSLEEFAEKRPPECSAK